MIINAPMRRKVTHAFDHKDLERLRSASQQLDLNMYESAALRGAIEALEDLANCRDEVESHRDQFSVNRDSKLLHPTQPQGRKLYSLTRVYFDTYYSTVSNILSVIARFSSVFGGRTFNELAPFIKWLDKSWGETPSGHDAVAELEQARLFRALVNHPQQFPVTNWHTFAAAGYRERPYITVFGPESRTQKIPPGATRTSVLIQSGALDADWSFDAPDEVRITNCVANLLADCLRDILSTRLPASAFRSYDRQREAADILIFGERPKRHVSIPSVPKLDLDQVLPNGLLVQAEYVVRFDKYDS
ncbi:MAG: hypothetical protein ACOH1M_02760 [Rhodoglobus sp.]